MNVDVKSGGWLPLTDRNTKKTNISDQRTIELRAMQLELSAFYPRVWKKILEEWGTLNCPGYLKQLMMVEADRSRVGFSAKAIAELLHLSKLHDRQFPRFAIKAKSVKGNTWTPIG